MRRKRTLVSSTDPSSVLRTPFFSAKNCLIIHLVSFSCYKLNMFDTLFENPGSSPDIRTSKMPMFIYWIQLEMNRSVCAIHGLFYELNFREKKRTSEIPKTSVLVVSDRWLNSQYSNGFCQLGKELKEVKTRKVSTKFITSSNLAFTLYRKRIYAGSGIDEGKWKLYSGGVNLIPIV